MNTNSFGNYEKAPESHTVTNFDPKKEDCNVPSLSEFQNQLNFPLSEQFKQNVQHCDHQKSSVQSDLIDKFQEESKEVSDKMCLQNDISKKEKIKAKRQKAKMKQNPKEVIEEETKGEDKKLDKKRKRNRSAARRSREKKEREFQALKNENQKLREEKVILLDQLNEAKRELGIFHETVRILPQESKTEFVRIKSHLTQENELPVRETEEFHGRPRCNSVLYLIGGIAISLCLFTYLYYGITPNDPNQPIGVLEDHKSRALVHSNVACKKCVDVGYIMR